MTRFRINARGQTTFDFAVGMGVFLITVAFVLTFIPSVFAPFTVGSGSAELVADRAAAALIGDILVNNPADPAVLNRSCTIDFFAGNTPPTCRFDTTDLGDVLGFPDKQLNVTILNPDTDTIATVGAQDLEKGAAPPADADVTTARRMVSINGTLYELRVRIW